MSTFLLRPQKEDLLFTCSTMCFMPKRDGCNHQPGVDLCHLWFVVPQRATIKFQTKCSLNWVLGGRMGVRKCMWGVYVHTRVCVCVCLSVCVLIACASASGKHVWGKNTSDIWYHCPQIPFVCGNTERTETFCDGKNGFRLQWNNMGMDRLRLVYYWCFVFLRHVGMFLSPHCWIIYSHKQQHVKLCVHKSRANICSAKGRAVFKEMERLIA